MNGEHWESNKDFIGNITSFINLVCVHRVSFQSDDALLEPFVLMFRRLLKYRVEPDPVLQQQNTHFPTTRMPVSATMNISSSYPLGDSTNTKKSMALRSGTTTTGGLRMAANPYKMIHDNIDEEEDSELQESGFVSHCDE